jgi:Domain of unknown function (DUF4188)
MSSPGVTSKIENQMTRRSNETLCDLRFLPVAELMTRGLETIFFHPPVQRAAAQTQSLCRLAHVTLKALQRLADQDTFNCFETQFRPAWAAFNRAVASRGDVGIWYETYCVRATDFECIYNNMPPFGLGKATTLVPARGHLDTAEGRMNQQHERAAQ